MGKGGMINAAQQKMMADKMKRNPNEVLKKINQMDSATLRQLGGSQNVMNMLKGEGGMPGGGMPSMEAMQALMGGHGAGGDGMPGFDVLQAMMGGGAASGGMAPPPGLPTLPPGMDMNQMLKMMQQFGMGGMPR